MYLFECFRQNRHHHRNIVQHTFSNSLLNPRQMKVQKFRDRFCIYVSVGLQASPLVSAVAV